MIIKLNLKTGAILVAALAILGAGIAYATTQISRDVSGTFIVGQVQTTDDTIQLYSQIDPAIGLSELDFGSEDIDAFGSFVERPRVEFWAANGGGTAFELRVKIKEVPVTRDGNPVTTEQEIFSATLGPASTETQRISNPGVVFEPNDEPVKMEVTLQFLSPNPPKEGVGLAS